MHVTGSVKEEIRFKLFFKLVCNASAHVLNAC